MLTGQRSQIAITVLKCHPHSLSRRQYRRELSMQTLKPTTTRQQSRVQRRTLRKLRATTADGKTRAAMRPPKTSLRKLRATTTDSNTRAAMRPPKTTSSDRAKGGAATGAMRPFKAAERYGAATGRLQNWMGNGDKCSHGANTLPHEIAAGDPG